MARFSFKVMANIVLSMVTILAAAGVCAQDLGAVPQSTGVQPMPVSAPVARKDPRDSMDISVDVGAGLLEFLHINVSYLHSREWTFGLGVGAFPIDRLLNRVAGTEDLSASATVAGYELSGEVDTRLLSGRIFARWFPWKKLFFAEGTVEAWYMDMVAKASFEEESTGRNLTFETTAKVWVPMVGLHIGWRFLTKKGFYADLAMGIDFLLSPGADVSFGGSAVKMARLNPEITESLDQAEDFFGDALEDGANRMTKKIRVFPTGALRLGWAFDL